MVDSDPQHDAPLLEDMSHSPEPRYGSCEKGTQEQNPSHDKFHECSGASAAAARLSSTQRKLLAGLVVVSLLNGSLIAIMIPFFPVEAASRGVSQTVISGVFSSFALVQMLLSPLVGRLAPAVGVTRLYNVGIATAGLSTAAFGALAHIGDTATFVAACFAVRAVEAAGTAAVAGCAFTIIGNRFGGRASTVVALVAAAQSVGLSVAPAVGGGLYALAGFGLPFYALGATMVVAGAANYWLMPALAAPVRRAAPFLGMLAAFAGAADNWTCLLAVFFYAFAFLTLDSSVAPYAATALGVTPATLGLFFTVATLAYVPASFAWARLAERGGNVYATMAACVLAAAAAMLLIPPSPLLGLAPRWWLLLLGMTLQEVCLAGAYVPCLQQMLRACVRRGLPDDVTTQAFVSSVYWTGYSLGTVVGPLSGGLLVDAYGFPVMMTCLAGLALLVALLTVMQAVANCRHVSRAAKTPDCSPGAQ